MQKMFYIFFSLTIFSLSAVLIKADDKSSAAKTGDEVPEVNTPVEIVRCWGMSFAIGKDFTYKKQVIDKIYFFDGEEERRLTSSGFGIDWYPSKKISLALIGSVGIGNDKQEDTTFTDEDNETELGAKLSLNWYPHGMTELVYFSIGPWISFISYSRTITVTSNGFESKQELTASRFGFGVNASAYVHPWKDLNLEFFAGYNLGAFITPEGTNKITLNGSTTENNGPSSFHFNDCGGTLGIRYFFDSNQEKF